MIKIKVHGTWRDTERYLKQRNDPRHLLHTFGKLGVEALAAATPVDTGQTANSWNYEVEQTSSGYKVTWTNSNVNDYVVIALILQYGHGTAGGSWISGRDYINPALAPIFDGFAEQAWKEAK